MPISASVSFCLKLSLKKTLGQFGCQENEWMNENMFSSLIASVTKYPQKIILVLSVVADCPFKMRSRDGECRSWW
jgi:hypothetical protein